MAGSRGIILCVCFILIVTGTALKNGKPKKKRVSVFVLNKRLIVAEKTLVKVKQELNDTRQELHTLQSDVAQLKSALSTGAVGASGNSSGGSTFQLPKRFSSLPGCPDVDGFYMSAEHRACYSLQPASLLQNFTEATSTCQSLHPKAHIVAVQNPSEHEFLRQMWFNERGIASISRFWINLAKEEGKDRWKWADSGKRLLYQNWIPTTSHDNDEFQCAAVYSNEGYYWGDVACWGPHMVTCEIDL